MLEVEDDRSTWIIKRTYLKANVLIFWYGELYDEYNGNLQC